MADASKPVKNFITPFGMVSVGVKVTLRNIETRETTNLITDFITEMKVGCNIFDYHHPGYIVYADKGGI